MSCNSMLYNGSDDINTNTIMTITDVNTIITTITFRSRSKLSIKP